MIELAGNMRIHFLSDVATGEGGKQEKKTADKDDALFCHKKVLAASR